jgi:serine protease inhibitor
MDFFHSQSDQMTSEIDKELVSGNTRFALNILKELQKEDKSKNIFISPLSLSMTLAIIHNGAEGQTRDAIAKTLQIDKINLQTVNQGFKDLIDQQLNADDQVSIHIGNSIWIRKSFEKFVKDDFKCFLIKYFGGEVLSRQFSDPGTVNEINS